MKRIVFAGMMAALVAACAQTPPPAPAATSYQISTPFNEADFTPWTGNGPGALKGQAFLMTIGGNAKTCAGQNVILIPANAYNDEIEQEIVAHGTMTFVNRDPRAQTFNRTATCDVQGGFTFSNLPKGDWWVFTVVRWGVPGQTGVETQGGGLLKRVTLADGANEVILSEADLIR